MAQLLSQVSEGTIVKLNESGKPVEFYVAKKNYESELNGSGRVLLVRKDCYDERQWNNVDQNAWDTSSLRLWLNGSYSSPYISLLDPWVKEAIGTTTYYYTPGNGDRTVTTRSDAVFQLSAKELGSSSSFTNAEGSTVPIYSTLNSYPTAQWTRTPSILGTDSVAIINSNGVNHIKCTPSAGSRPCFTLPSTVYVQSDGTISQYAGPAPTNFTYPVTAMQGISIPLFWGAVVGADSYIVQRKVDSGEWTQVYSGSATTFTDTAGSWTTVQYQLCGVFDGTNGAFATSTTITIISASALAISGEDEDLGTITNDVTYSVATSTGNPISLTRFVNGIQVASLTVNSGFSYSIPVMELPTGSGTIVITATVQATSGPVTQTRTWTYTKTPVTFPDAGAVGVLAQGGQNVLPVTAAEAVRVSPAWGGSLDKALDFIRGPGSIVQSYPIASGQTVTAGQVVDVVKSDGPATVSVGQEVNLLRNGELVPHIILHIGKPSTSLYDDSCNGVWVIRKDITELGAWNSSSVNALPGSTIMNAMQDSIQEYAPSIQSAMKKVKVPYCTGGSNPSINSGASGFSCTIFPLSGYELGWTTSDNPYFPVDGAVLDYFAGTSSTDQKRIANFNGEPTGYYTRSPTTLYGNTVWRVQVNGSSSSTTCTINTVGYREAFILPIGTVFNEDGTVTVEQQITTSGTPSQAIALQGGSEGDTIPVIFSGVAQLSGVTQGQQITSPGVQGFGAMDGWLSVFPYWRPKSSASGSYTGTGSYGSSSPVVLAIPIDYKLIIVRGQVDVDPIGIFLSTGDGSLLQSNTGWGRLTASRSSNELSFYNTTGAVNQLNEIGENYIWSAFG